MISTDAVSIVSIGSQCLLRPRSISQHILPVFNKRGLVGMLQKSGGMAGFTRDVATFATTARSGQFACFGIGVFVFFDDYANVLLAGESMRPLLDALFVSREKLSFIVDATAAPIASTLLGMGLYISSSLPIKQVFLRLVVGSGLRWTLSKQRSMN